MSPCSIISKSTQTFRLYRRKSVVVALRIYSLTREKERERERDRDRDRKRIFCPAGRNEILAIETSGGEDRAKAPIELLGNSIQEESAAEREKEREPKERDGGTQGFPWVGFSGCHRISP